MANRFGGTNAAYAAQAKMRFALGVLFMMIFILVGALIYVVTRMDQQAGLGIVTQNVDGGNAEGAPVIPTVDVLVAGLALQPGTQITAEVLAMRAEDQQRIPQGAILARERDQILGKFTTVSIATGQIIKASDLSQFRPLVKIEIPPGYRAVTISVDSRSGVEGWARPNTKVDVIWTFLEDGSKKVATIVRQVKVLSFAGARQTEEERVAVGDKGGVTTVTLQVTEEDSKIIEYARTNGELSLTLVGDEEPEMPKEDSKRVVDKFTVLGIPKTSVQQGPTNQIAPVEENEEEDVGGVMIATDPETGQQKRYKLVKTKKGQKWIIDENWE